MREQIAERSPALAAQVASRHRPRGPPPGDESPGPADRRRLCVPRRVRALADECARAAGPGGRPRAHARSEGFWFWGRLWLLVPAPRDPVARLGSCCARTGLTQPRPEAGGGARGRMGQGRRAGIQMPPLLLGGHLRATSPLPAITAAHGAEQAARHACSHPPFSGLTWVFGVGLRTRWKDWGKGSTGSPGIGCPCSYRGVVRSSNRFLSVGPCAVCDLKDKPKRPKP